MKYKTTKKVLYAKNTGQLDMFSSIGPQAEKTLGFALKHFRKDVESPREFQEAIAASALKRDKEGNPVSTMVVLPTGVGKTMIGAMVADRLLEGGKVLFIGHTGPLVRQQAKYFKSLFDLPDGEIVSIVGSKLRPEKRGEIYSSGAKIIFATSQSVAKDIESGRLSLKGYSCLISDETHHTVGRHSHHVAAKEAIKCGVPRLALTASPGDTLEKIVEVMSNLKINNIEIRMKNDADVKRYVHELTVERMETDLPRLFKQIRERIYGLSLPPLSMLGRMGFLENAGDLAGQGDLFAGNDNPKEGKITLESAAKFMKYANIERIKKNIENYASSLKNLRDIDGASERAKEWLGKEIKYRPSLRGVPDPGECLKNMAFSRNSELTMYYQLLRMFETQSLHAGLAYIENNIMGVRAAGRIMKIKEKMDAEQRRASQVELASMNKYGREMGAGYRQRIRSNPEFRRMYDYISKNIETVAEHPKIELLMEALLKHPERKFIVFSESREQVLYLEKCAKTWGMGAAVLLGKTNGVTESDQDRAIQKFNRDEARLLICTQIGREGLDMPSANVINYDQVGTGVAFIQRTGRDRTEHGLVIDLITKDTADEYSRYRAIAATKKMHMALIKLKREFDAQLAA